MKALCKVFVEKSTKELTQEIYLLQQGAGGCGDFNAGAMAALQWVLHGEARPSTITIQEGVANV